MGVRVLFHLGAADGLEGVFWSSGPHLFRDWAQVVEAEDPGVFSAELLRRLDRIVAEGPSSLVPADQHDAEIIDRIFDLFVEYSSYRPEDEVTSANPLLRLASGSMIYVHGYREVQARIESRCSPQTALCWSQLLNGRAVGRPPTIYPYSPNPDDEEYRIGYWTAEEVRTIHDDLRAIFPADVPRGKVRWRDWFARTRVDERAIEIVIDATTRALAEATGLITSVG